MRIAILLVANIALAQAPGHWSPANILVTPTTGHPTGLTATMNPGPNEMVCSLSTEYWPGIKIYCGHPHQGWSLTSTLVYVAEGPNDGTTGSFSSNYGTDYAGGAIPNSFHYILRHTTSQRVIEWQVVANDARSNGKWECAPAGGIHCPTGASASANHAKQIRISVRK